MIHKVNIMYKRKLISFPYKPEYIKSCFITLNLKSDEDTQNYFNTVRVKIKSPKNSEEMVLNYVGRDFFKSFIKDYTFKQWGIEANKLAPSVTARIPVRTNTDDRYFTDSYQGIPKEGYTKMFEKMLNHKNITVLLNTDYKDIMDSVKFDKIIYTGAIDEFFDFSFGKLPYRSLRFEHETMNVNYSQSIPHY